MPKKPPQVSVIIPTYNRSKMIGDCIEAILQQSMQDFELIVVSDGSTDDTKDVVFSYGDSRIHFFEKENGGQASARNYGLTKATGIYVSLCDDDDRFYSHHLETLCSFLTTNSNIGLAYSDALWVYENSGKEPEVRYSHDFDKRSLENYNYITPLNTMFRKSCLTETETLNEDPNLKGLEDWEFFLRLSDNYNFAHIKEVTSQYTVHTDNSFQPNSGYNYLKAFYLVRTMRFQHLLSKYGLFLFDHVNYMYPYHLLHCYLENGRTSLALEIGTNLYDLYNEYKKHKTPSNLTEVLLLFSLIIAHFLSTNKNKAEVFVKFLQDCPFFHLAKPQFITFVNSYINMNFNKSLNAFLHHHIIMGSTL